MNARSILDSLHQLCTDIDEGRPVRRLGLRHHLTKLAVPAVLGLSSVAMTGCISGQATDPGTLPGPIIVEPVVVVTPEQCGDGVDNDLDGQIDCGDTDCHTLRDCLAPPVALYGVPIEPPLPPPAAEVCNDGRDNDRDGQIDCSDLDCNNSGFCISVAAYAVPFEPPQEICHDNIDNDGDGQIDCDDIDCGCATAEYAAPFEPICPDGDGDGDGTPDCLEPDPGDHLRPMYGVPFVR